MDEEVAEPAQEIGLQYAELSEPHNFRQNIALRFV
jgi:hypothetical protein